MDRDEIIRRLRKHEPALRARGVSRAALFGSRARGDSRPDSDADILVEINPSAALTIFDYVDLKEYIAALIGGEVDVVSAEGLKPYIRSMVTVDALYAF